MSEYLINLCILLKADDTQDTRRYRMAEIKAFTNLAYGHKQTI